MKGNNRKTEGYSNMRKNEVTYLQESLQLNAFEKGDQKSLFPWIHISHSRAHGSVRMEVLDGVEKLC